MKFPFLLLAVLSLPEPSFAQWDEYTVKAAFLERFTRFVEWPEESAIADTAQPFVIGVIGDNPFGPTLERLYTQQDIKSKNVSIRYITSVDEIAECHMLFISRSSAQMLPDILAFTRDRAILTVGDTNGFAENGVHINFYLLEDKVHFEINETEIEASLLSMSYLLLRVARIVEPTRGGMD